MHRIPLLLLLVLLAGFSPALGQEDVLVGRIVGLDREQRTLLLDLAQGAGEPGAAPETIPAPAPSQLVQFSGLQGGMGQGLPRFLYEGSLVRVWGRFDKAAPPVFHAERIRPADCGSDPTGVRQRLGRGCRFPGACLLPPADPPATPGPAEPALQGGEADDSSTIGQGGAHHGGKGHSGNGGGNGGGGGSGGGGGR